MSSTHSNHIRTLVLFVWRTYPGWPSIHPCSHDTTILCRSTTKDPHTTHCHRFWISSLATKLMGMTIGLPWLALASHTPLPCWADPPPGHEHNDKHYIVLGYNIAAQYCHFTTAVTNHQHIACVCCMHNIMIMSVQIWSAPTLEAASQPPYNSGV